MINRIGLVGNAPGWAWAAVIAAVDTNKRAANAASGLINERIQFSSEVSSGPAFRAVRCLSRTTQAAHLRIMRTALHFVQNLPGGVH